MHEVFSKTTGQNVPLQQQEYFELRLDDLGIPFRPQFIVSMGAIARHRFLVFQAHAAWSEIDINIMWDGFEHDEFSTLEEAERRYKERRAAIVDKGFAILACLRQVAGLAASWTTDRICLGYVEDRLAAHPIQVSHLLIRQSRSGLQCI